jgi:uncharacterized membrane protein SpoIIM required for sporulation
MTRQRFLALRRPAWQRFHELLYRAERSRVPKFSGEEVSEFSRLFRALCHDLATVRSRDWGQDLERYLNDLVARGHNNFYRSPPGKWREVLQFFSESFPRLLRENIAYFWVALALFSLPGAICGVLVGRDPSLAGRVLPGMVLVELEDMYSEGMWSRDAGETADTSQSAGQPARRRSGDGPGDMRAGMAGFYIHNNIGIALRCFALGILFGAGTIVILVYNSIFMGTVTGYLVAHGHSERFFTFVIAHGSFELTAIVVSGAAGLVIGHALVSPGPFTRAEALKRRGLVGVQLAAGAAGMLAVAALIEAFWSPSPVPPLAKYLVGAMFWVFVVFYLTFAGREERRS